MCEAAQELPQYQSHKKVWALQIAGIEYLNSGELLITPTNKTFKPFTVEKQYIPKHDAARPSIGWYFVMYSDGYKSFSPAKAFEDGYTLVKK